MNEKIMIVMPAYNAALTLKNVYKEIPRDLIYQILLVDDGSTDATVKISKELGIQTVVHEKNLGYGGNQKTCYTQALESEADLIIMLHPDGQYDPHDISKFIECYRESGADMILGSRFKSCGHKQTPLYKSISIRVITFLFNLVLGTNLTEANTGYRAYSRRFLESVPWGGNGDGYLFDPQCIIQAEYFGFKIADVPITKSYHESASSPTFLISLHHGIENLVLLILYLLHKSKIIKTNFLIS
jgi:glycosyltransferase involved in cell wall biosynthesis